jgi:hypothetical protein
MPRERKARIQEVNIETGTIPTTYRKQLLTSVEEEVISNKFNLGDLNFDVIAFADRQDDSDQVYRDASEFLLGVVPVVMRALNLIGTMGNYGVQNSQPTEDGKVEIDLTDSDTVALLNEIDVGSAVRELGETLPKLVAMVCRGTNPRITESEVMRLAKRPWNPNLVKAVLLQIKADNLFAEIGEAKRVIEEFGILAQS